MQRLNPYAKTQAALEAKAIEARKVSRKASIKAKQSKAGRKDKVTRNTRFANLGTEMETGAKKKSNTLLEDVRESQNGTNIVFVSLMMDFRMFY